MYTKQQLNNYLEWDIYSWSKAIDSWDEILNKQSNLKELKALELGGRNGGLSLFLAQKGIHTVCSDFGGPTPKANALHQQENVASIIEYADIDASNINFPDAQFDIVIFKSILGVVAANGKTENLALASNEIFRVLKPGGILLFAENMKASSMHSWARKKFVRWGNNWHYLSINEMEQFVAPYQTKKIQYFGFISAFVKIAALKKLAYFIDLLKYRFIPNSWKYIAYGWAQKAQN